MPEAYVSLTKYLTPEFAPSVSLKSKTNSKAPNFSLVNISPPLPDSFPPEEFTCNIPSSTVQTLGGAVVLNADLKPVKSLPLNSNLNPKDFS